MFLVLEHEETRLEIMLLTTQPSLLFRWVNIHWKVTKIRILLASDNDKMLVPDKTATVVTKIFNRRVQ